MSITKKKKLRLKLFILYLLSFAVAVGPLGSIFIKNFDRYVTNVGDAFKLSVGAILIIIVMILKVLGKLKLPGKLITATLFVVMCWLFASLLQDLLVISVAWWISEVIDYLILSPLIKRTKEAILIDKTASATAAAIRGI